jgi:hypothetical protein
MIRALRSDTGFVVGQFLLSRAIYLAGGLLTALLVSAGPTERLHRLIGPAGNALYGLLVHGDGGWYLRIVRNGYEAIPFSADAQHDWAFFPLYPILVRLLGGEVIAGIVLANVLALLAALLLVTEVRAIATRPAARWTVLFVLYWPFSGMLSSFRPESLLLLLAVATWALGRRGHWWAAWLCVGLATLTRPQGLLVALLLMDPVRARRAEIRRHPLPLVAGALIPLVALGAFSWYLGTLTGDPLAWAHIQAAWGRTGFDPLRLIGTYWPPYFVRYAWDFAFLNWIILIVMLAGAVLLVRLRRPGMALFSAAWILVAVSLGASTIALGRYAAVVFPVAIAAATHRGLRRYRVTILTVMAALLFGVGAWTALGIRAVQP